MVVDAAVIDQAPGVMVDGEGFSAGLIEESGDLSKGNRVMEAGFSVQIRFLGMIVEWSDGIRALSLLVGIGVNGKLKGSSNSYLE